jgi:hypothetical protein
VPVSYKYANHRSGCVKGGEFLGWMSDYELFKKYFVVWAKLISPSSCYFLFLRFTTCPEQLEKDIWT